MFRNSVLVLFIVYLAAVSAVINTPLYKRRFAKERQLLPQPPLMSNETFWFTQLVDHFDPNNDETFQQQYQVIDDYFDGTGPIFFFLAGEAPMGFFNFQEVQIWNWADKFNALYVVLEHRFYGASNPTNDFSTPNLRYLTSQQALADAANFLTSFKAERGLESAPVVVFGCSYSGALSAWFRLKYPQLVVASVAPSGPVLAQLNYTGYYSQFSNSAAPDCVAAAQTATNQIMALTTSKSGRDQLAKTFNSCSNLENPRDLYYFLYTLTEALGSADQMNNPPTWGLNTTCQTLTQTSSLLDNWAQIVAGGQTGCQDYSLKSFIDSMRKTNSKDQDGSRSWLWQTCVEFGYFSTTYPGTSVFPPTLNVEEQVKWCEEIFDIKGMTPNIAWTNSYYGGQQIQGSNIMFTNGLLDPWHLLSVNEPNLEGTVQAATYEAGHCGTLIQSTSIDPPSLIAARAQKLSQFNEMHTLIRFPCDNVEKRGSWT
ncbi:hypothetical protein PPL_00255 [Heterostelium album PN500]|uniref:Uncharacterized protein n=1 Tax=Heterostelium pallidum (strain ATCC 26659 / Pp 5 / PN500) TaxID=670386 RepID=D3AVY9_HETP5|nr:hypothetical protein PPL_00255 [Heterostelium album PN500]EFA86462.1 hypothetical protein PPL_00255 [Heterostelium album PN500]|eukprot:XP_020438567.1 hypothetical protein PPL_00255 [Heterostelium album PN500]